MNLVSRSFRRRSMNMEMMKMVVWCPRLNMYLLLRLRSRMGPLPHLQRQTQIKAELLLRERWHQAKNLPNEFKWIIVDGAKPCSSSPQTYEWLGVFFTKEGPPKICQSKDRKQITKVLYLTYQSNPM
jgi:hypothetical protein